MSNKVVKLLFGDKDEAIDIIDTGGDLLKYLTGKQTFCPLIGTKITLEKVLGKGNYGEVFQIDFPGKGKKRYAVKRSRVQRIDPCSKEDSYKRFDGKGKTIIPKGSSICEMAYSEYAISLLTGELVRDGTCINFMDVFAFSMCPNPNTNSYSQYTFMEQINGSFRRKVGCIAEKPSSRGQKTGPKMTKATRKILTDSVLIQTLFALAVLSRSYQIVHGDLHDDNIFLVHDPDMEWNGKRITDYDYYEYKIDGKSIYIPGIPLIVKIGDFGLAVKYSAPMVGNKTTMENGYDQYDGGGPWLPNFFTPAYDTTFVVRIFNELNPSNEFVKQIAGWVFGLKPGFNKEELKGAAIRMLAYTDRPKISELETGFKHVSPDAILLNDDLMKDYLKPPPKGSKVLVIGELS